MFRRSTSNTVTDPSTGPVRLDQPHDTCIRCGRPTPVGVSLCERDNPGRIKSPSATQVHGTVLIGVLGGFVGLALIFALTSAGAGPFTATVTGVATRADGGLDVAFQVANGGTRQSGATCRISPDGAPDYRDYTFFTEPIPPGESRQFTRPLDIAAGDGLNVAQVAVSCN